MSKNIYIKPCIQVQEVELLHFILASNTGPDINNNGTQVNIPGTGGGGNASGGRMKAFNFGQEEEE